MYSGDSYVKDDSDTAVAVADVVAGYAADEASTDEAWASNAYVEMCKVASESSDAASVVKIRD